MMRRYSTIHSILIVMFIASLCSAQPWDRRRVLPENLVLISLPEIQQELEVTSQQTKLIEALQADLVSQLGSRSRRSRSDNRETRQQQTAVSAKLWNVVLEKSQSQRFSQLRLQFRGLYAVDDPEFAEDLDLTDEQQRQIRDLRADNNPIEVSAALDGILNESQIKQWQAKLGKSFEFTEDTLRFRDFYLSRSRLRGRRGRGGFGQPPNSDSEESRDR